MNIDSSTRAALDAALSRIKVDADNTQKELLLKHLSLVIEANKKLNLTRIVSPEDAVIGHIEDSLSILEDFSQYGNRYLDIGTGAGYPGIPLGIMTDKTGVLIDSVKKKADAVQGFINELGLTDRIEARGIRSEELALEQPESFDIVIGRAVSSAVVLQELSAPLLRSKGYFLLMKGLETTEDEKRAQDASQKLGFELISKKSFTVGPERFNRTLYTYQKTGSPSISLPRRNGMAAKRPLA